MDKNRLLFVDIAKGICILLVVLGHYNPPGAPAWYSSFILFIYTFHMPVFMCMSGFLFYKSFDPQQSFGGFTVKKIKRLLVPYLVISILLISIKLLLQQFVVIENPVTTFSYVKMLYYPIAGYFLWFMYALFVIFILTFSILKYIKNSLLIPGITALILFGFIEYIPDYCCLPQVIIMLPAFLLGCCLYKYSGILKPKISTVALFFIHVIAFILIEKWEPEGVFLYFCNMLMGLAACIYVAQLSCSLEKSRKIVSLFLLMGVMSNAIYLFHTSVMAPFKYVWLRFIGIESTLLFLLSAVFIAGMGVIVPVYLKKWILKNKLLSALILGE